MNGLREKRSLGSETSVICRFLHDSEYELGDREGQRALEGDLPPE